MGKRSDDDPPVKRKGKSLKAYALRVFQDSSIDTISCIASTPSKKRKFFKAFVLAFCLTGFLYQSIKFLTVVFSYPTNVGIEIIRPRNLLVPAYTFCNNNGIQRTLFCEKYPNYCMTANETMCLAYGLHCRKKKTMIPMESYYKAERILTQNEVIALNGELDQLLLYYESDNSAGEPIEHAESQNNEYLTGPFLRTRDLYDLSLMTCYSLNEKVNSSDDPLMTKKKKLVKTPVNSFVFQVEAAELFIPGNWPGVLFAIHSPFEAVNPFEIGIYMKPGITYTIQVSMDEEILLPRPYQTDCTNYTALWEANGRKGPRMQEMCRQKCLAEISLECYNCTVPMLLYPTSARMCTEGDLKTDDCPDNVNEKLDACEKGCKDDCHRIKYRYTVQERPSVKSSLSIRDGDEIEKLIFVKVYIEDDEVIILKHFPKYMVVEVFGTIGGFVGGWLGISLLDVTDLFEGFFRIIRYAFKRR